MDKINFKKLALKTALCFVACSGKIDESEIERIKILYEESLTEKSLLINDEITSLIKDLNQKGIDFYVEYFSDLIRAELLEEEKLSLINVSFVSLSEFKTEQCSVMNNLFEIVQNSLKISNEKILEAYPGMWAYLNDESLKDSDTEQLKDKFLETVILPQLDDNILLSKEIELSDSDSTTFNALIPTEVSTESLNSIDEIQDQRPYWQFKDKNSNLRYFYDEESIRESILHGDISPEDKLKFFDMPNETGIRQESEWQKVSDSIAKSESFRFLFEPVWSHTVRGAVIGATLGIIWWLFNGIPMMIEIKSIAGVTIFIYALIAACTSLLPNDLIEIKVFVFGKLSSVVMFIVGFMTVKMGLQLIIFSLSALAGAVITGALAGVFPGMIIGTIVGYIRKNSIGCAPNVLPENNMNLLLKGVVIPLIIFTILTWSYMTYLPLLIDDLLISMAK